MQRRLITISLIVGAVLGLSLVLSVGYRQRQNPSPLPTAPTPTESTAPTSPLSIAAVRAHILTSSTISTTQTLASRGGCATSVVSFISDGLTEYALVQVPSAAKPTGGYPVIVFAHGYIDPASYQTAGSEYADFLNFYCSHGYIVIKPDFRGNGKSQGDAVGGDLAAGYTYDVLNLVASLGSLPQANAKSVALVAHSMGGAVALRAAVADHGLPIKAYVFASGVVGSLEDIAYNWPATEFPADLVPEKAALITQYGTPQANPAFWHDASSINYVASITVPVQINHGTADTTVPIAFARSLDAALTKAGKTHQFITYPGGDHQYSNATIRTQFLNESLQFLQGYAR